MIGFRLTCVVAGLSLLAATSAPLAAQNALGRSGGISSGPTGIGAGRGGLGTGRSVIGNGRGGFTVYSPRGAGRFVGDTATGGRVYEPGGGTSLVIPDGEGGAVVYGPRGPERFHGDSAPNRPSAQRDGR